METGRERMWAGLALGLAVVAGVTVGALAVVAALRRADPSDSFAQALDHYANGHWRQAAAGFRASGDAARPAGEEARFNLGLALYRDGRFGEAGETFASLARSADEVVSVRARFNEGNCAYRLHEPSGAAEAYRDAMAGAQQALDSLPQDAPHVETFSQVRKRARHNLSVALQAERAGAASDLALAADPEEPLALRGDDDIGTEPPGMSQGIAGAADAGMVPMEEALPHVLSRDTGPQFERGNVRARPGGKDW